MSKFTQDVKRFVQLTTRAEKAVFIGVAQKVHESIQVGSPITGAPGQPVDTGNLRNSWQLQFPSPTSAEIGTNMEYAIPVEDGVGPHGPVKYGKSGIGGSHSVKLTQAAFPRLVEHVSKEVTGGV